MRDHANHSEDWQDYETERQKLPLIPGAVIAILLLAGLAFYLQLKRNQVLQTKKPPPEGNAYYSGYKRSTYPGVQGSHDGVQNGFDVANGVFGKCTNTRIRDITDGTSNTFMVGERDLSLNHGAIWMRSVNFDGTAEDARAIVGVCFKTHSPGSHTDPHAFSSMHEGGVHFLLGDGSVRFIQENIDPDIYNRLAQRNDGKIIPPF